MSEGKRIALFLRNSIAIDKKNTQENIRENIVKKRDTVFRCPLIFLFLGRRNRKIFI